MQFETPISVVVPLFNSGSCLQETLDAFCSIDYLKSKIEILLAYFPSNDSTLEIITTFRNRHGSEYSRINILECQKRGLSFGRNLGIRNSRSGYIYFMDDDTPPSKEAFKHALTIFEKDEKVGAVCFPYVHPQPNILERATWVLRFDGRIVQTKTFGGGAVMIRKKVLDEIKLFNEKLGYPYSSHDDLELAARMKRNGYCIIIDGTSTLIHLPKKREDAQTGNGKLSSVTKQWKYYFSDGADSYHEVLRAAPISWTLELALYFSLPLPFIILLTLQCYITGSLYFVILLAISVFHWRAFSLDKLSLVLILLSGRVLRSYGYVARAIWRLFGRRERLKDLAQEDRSFGTSKS